MRCIALVGCTGSGKTFRTRQLVSKANPKALRIFDVNDEWEDLYPFPFDPSMDKFLDKCEKTEDGVIVIEDATSFFSTQGRSQKLVELLVAKRHSNNTYILLFHAFADFPKYIYRKCTDIIIFKTLDGIQHLNAIGNEQLTAAWQEVQNQANGHEFFSTQPPPSGVVPPSKHFSVY
jgi:hypothetical protein